MTGSVKRPYVSLVRSPTVKLRLESRPRASALGRKPISRAIRLIRSRVASAMRPLSLSAFDTVETLTPATLARSWMVMRLPFKRGVFRMASRPLWREKTFSLMKCQYEKTFSHSIFVKFCDGSKLPESH